MNNIKKDKFIKDYQSAELKDNLKLGASILISCGFAWGINAFLGIEGKDAAKLGLQTFATFEAGQLLGISVDGTYRSKVKNNYGIKTQDEVEQLFEGLDHEVKKGEVINFPTVNFKHDEHTFAEATNEK